MNYNECTFRGCAKKGCPYGNNVIECVNGKLSVPVKSEKQNEYQIALNVRKEFLSLPNDTTVGSFDAWLVKKSMEEKKNTICSVCVGSGRPSGITNYGVKYYCSKCGGEGKL